jgi:hypothetical protein
MDCPLFVVLLCNNPKIENLICKNKKVGTKRMKEHKIVRYLLQGRIFTNIGDSILYMLVIWCLSKEFSSPVLLSIAFATLAIVDALTVFIGPLVDSTVPKQNYSISSMANNVNNNKI